MIIRNLTQPFDCRHNPGGKTLFGHNPVHRIQKFHRNVAPRSVIDQEADFAGV
jgi:hypothetical protein